MHESRPCTADMLRILLATSRPHFHPGIFLPVGSMSFAAYLGSDVRML